MAYDTAELPLREEADFSIGAVFVRCLRTYRRRFVSFFLAAFVVIVPVVLALGMAFSALVRSPILANSAEYRNALAPAVGLLVYVALYAAESSLLGSAYRDMSGTTPALGRSVRDGLIRLPLVVVAVVVSCVAVMVAWMAFVIPGIIVFTMTAVTVPACVIERIGPFAAMSRSTALTKGYRWRVLAIYLVEIVGGFGCFLGSQVLLQRLLPAYLANIVVLGVAVALIAFVAVLNTAVYFELCSAEEGGAIDQLAAVFD